MLDVRLLGPVEVVSDGVPVALGRRHERWVLGCLALEAGRVVTTTRLLDLVWGDDPPASARATLHSHIARLRSRMSAVGLEIATRGSGYAADIPPDVVDVHRFIAGLAYAQRETDPLARIAVLDEALRLWRGPLMADCADDHMRRRLDAGLHERYLSAHELRAEADLATGGGHWVLTAVPGVLDAYPGRERLAAALMRAQQRGGDVAGALTTFEATRRYLADELGVDPGAELLALHRTAVRREGEPSVRRDVPRQLPAAVPDLTGRDTELTEFTRLLTATPPVDGAIQALALHGMGGVGKTSLAVGLGHRLGAWFSDGCLFADLHGLDAAPAQPSGVLAAFLRALGIPGNSLPSEPDERASLYRSILAERCVLVVLDNAAHEAQVRPLLPGAGGAVVITSRGELSGLDGVEHRALAPLPTDESLAFLRRVTGQTGAPSGDLREIAGLCAGLPLALRIAGVRLRSHSEPSLRLRLADERDRLGELAVGDREVRAVLSAGMDALSAPAATVLAAMSRLALTSHTAYTAAAIVNATPDEGRACLAELAAAGLLLPGAKPDRFSQHDLVRLHGAEQPLSEPIQDVAVRVYSGLLAAALRADQALPLRITLQPAGDAEPAFPAPQALAFFEGELDNLLRAARHAIDLGLPGLGIRLALSTVNFCGVRSLHEAAIEVLWYAHRSGAHTPDTMCALGNMLRVRDRNLEALPLLRRAFHGHRSAGDDHRSAVALFFWAVAVNELGRRQPARDALDTVARLLPVADTIHHGYLGIARYQLNADRAALDDALRIFTARGETFGVAEVQRLLANAYRQQGDLGTARRLTEQSAEQYELLDDRLSSTETKLSLANILMAEGADAEPTLRDAIDEATRMQHPWCLTTGHRLLGMVLARRDAIDDAQHHLELALEHARTHRLPALAASAQNQLARVYDRQGRRDDALRAARHALAVMEPSGSPAVGDLRAWLAEREGVASA